MKRHFVFASLILVLCGCATPKEIDGQKVIGTRWVKGRVVYILEGNEDAMKKGAAEAEEASKGVVFAPTKSD